jgi:hypothetical protein
MKVKVRLASNEPISTVVETVEINTIEDLIALEKKYNNSLIFGTYWSDVGDDKEEYSILVYDDYIE